MDGMRCQWGMCVIRMHDFGGVVCWWLTNTLRQHIFGLKYSLQNTCLVTLQSTLCISRWTVISLVQGGRKYHIKNHIYKKLNIASEVGLRYNICFCVHNGFLLTAYNQINIYCIISCQLYTNMYLLPYHRMLRFIFY